MVSQAATVVVAIVGLLVVLVALGAGLRAAMSWLVAMSRQRRRYEMARRQTAVHRRAVLIKQQLDQEAFRTAKAMTDAARRYRQR